VILNLILAALLVPVRADPSTGTVAAQPTQAAQQAQTEYLRGTLLERRGAYADALASYEKALTIDPTSAFIAGEAANLALELQDLDRAEKWARVRLDLAPNDARSRVILGRVLWARGDAAGAEVEYEQALKSDPTSEDTLFALVELSAARDPAKARARLEDFLKKNPDRAARALFELGRLDVSQGQVPAAIEKFKRSIELDDAQSGPAREALGQSYELMHDTAAAISTDLKILEDDPDAFELWAHVGELQESMGRLDDARQTFLDLKKRRPGDPAACAWLASDAERGGDFARAAAELKDSAALKDDPTLNLRLGYYQLQAGSMSEAMATLTEARRRWPKDDRIAYYLALGDDDQGRHDEAVALLREVLAIKPDDREARWQLATILERLNKMSEAEPEFRRLIADKPDDAPALNYLGYSFADRGMKLDDAKALIDRALALEPTNAAYQDSLGWVLFKLGRSTEAAHELAVAAQNLPDDDEVWGHIAEVRESLGDKNGAWRAWRLSQSFGGKKSGARADELQKKMSPEAAGELWRAHLAAIHAGVKRFAGVCSFEGRVGGHALSQKALLTFREPRQFSLEILGPLFSPIARATLDDKGFMMDAFHVDGLDDAQVRAAAEGSLSAISAVLAGAPFAAGPARLEGWSRRTLARPDWSVEIGPDALVRSATPAGGEALELSDFDKNRLRRIPRTFRARGRFWELTLSCPEAKIELDAPDEPLSEKP
jgi:tetratricopeptide (TPR) repeat protein